MSNVLPASGPSRKKQYIRIAVALVILAILGTLAFLRIEQELRISRDNSNYSAATQQSLALRGNKQYDQAVSVLKEYIADSSDPTHTAYAYVSIANIYESQRANQQALTAYRQAEVAGAPPYVVDIGIARVSYAQGDKTTAIAYYNKCIAILQKDKSLSPTPDDDITSLQSTVKQIETKQ